MMEVSDKFAGVVCGFIRILCFGRQIAEATLVVFGYIFFNFLLSDNGVEWVEFKNLFKSGAGQIVLDFFNFNLDFDLERVRFCVQRGLIHSRLFVSRDR
jgi:hypothetical protein